MLTLSVRSSNILGWVIEVYDETLPWGSSPVVRFDQLKKPTWKEKQGYLRDAELRLGHSRAQGPRREGTKPSVRARFTLDAVAAEQLALAGVA